MYLIIKDNTIKGTKVEYYLQEKDVSCTITKEGSYIFNRRGEKYCKTIWIPKFIFKILVYFNLIIYSKYIVPYNYKLKYVQ
jgi:hypothetical protein